ncbi:MAG: uncharacterized protein QOJ66_2999 [Ilumatobacteraceae bacterium]|jgi:uncharacterized OB-fold protein
MFEVTVDEYQFPGLPLPTAGGSENSAFWRWLSKHELRIQCCNGCGTTRTPAEPLCHVCYSSESSWVEAPTQGRIYSWTRVWHAAADGLVGRTPYVLVWVELDHPDRPRFLGNLLGDPLEPVEIDSPVTAVFEDFGAGTLLNWRRDIIAGT